MSDLPTLRRPHPDDRAFAGNEPVGDCLCSRCLQSISDREMPIWFWTGDGTWAWRYHPKCLGMQEFNDDDDGWFEGVDDDAEVAEEATESGASPDDWFEWDDEDDWLEWDDEDPEPVAEDPKEEFRIAFEQLAQDKQLIDLHLAKFQGWSVLSAVQLAAIHPLGKSSPSVKVAVQVARRLESLIVGDSPRFALVARAGWNRKEVQIPLEETIAVMREHNNDAVMLTIKKVEAWYLVSAIQLAFRHPEFSESFIGNIAKKTANQLQPALATEGILALFLDAGWDTRFDRA